MVNFTSSISTAVVAALLLSTNVAAAPRKATTTKTVTTTATTTKATVSVETKVVTVASTSSVKSSSTAKTTSTAKSSSTGKSTSTAKSSSKSSSTSASSTSAAPIATKTAVSDCNIQGTAATDMLTYLRHNTTEATVYACQTYCFEDSPCESYSYDAQTGVCTTYRTLLNLVESSSSATFFSDKYPADGSNYCYGSTGY